jgi:hypothetical protein
MVLLVFRQRWINHVLLHSITGILSGWLYGIRHLFVKSIRAALAASED